MCAQDVVSETSPPAGTADAPRRSRAMGIVVATLVVVFSLGVAWVALRAMGGGELGQDPFGRAAPGFELPMLDGTGTLALSDLRGSPVVLNFWASWCGPCKDEAPVLAAAERTWRARGVRFLGVDTTDARQAGREFERSFGIGYPSVMDETGDLSTAYGVLGFPETFFIDAKGTIVAKYVGPLDARSLDSYLASIVGR